MQLRYLRYYENHAEPIHPTTKYAPPKTIIQQVY